VISSNGLLGLQICKFVPVKLRKFVTHTGQIMTKRGNWIVFTGRHMAVYESLKIGMGAPHVTILKIGFRPGGAMKLNKKRSVIRYPRGHVPCMGIVKSPIPVCIDEGSVDMTPDSFVCP